jgi:O-antigen/teichoic acid export membrane protein
MFQRIKSFFLENRSTRQTVVKNTFWLGVGQVGGRLVRAAVLVYAARLMGAAQYGVFSYALGLSGFFTVFADLGTSGILAREMTQKPQDKSFYFSTIFNVKFLLLVVSGIILLFGAPLFSKIPEANSLLPWIALLIIFDGLRDFIASYFRAEQKMEWEALITSITNIGIAVFGVIILFFSRSASSITLTYVGSAGLGTLAGIFILKEEFLNVAKNFRKELLKPLFRAVAPYAVLSVMGLFMLNTDILMIGWWRGATEVGWYSAAVRLVSILYTVPSILASAAFPILSKAIGEKDDERVKKITEYGMAAILAMAIPTSVGGIILGKGIMSLLYGPSFANGTLSFELLISTLIFAFPLPFLSNYIFAFNEQKRTILSVGVGALGNVAFNILLIPRWGGPGSAVSTILAQLLNVGILWQIDKRIKNFHTLKHLYKIIAATIVMSVGTLFMLAAGLNVLLNIGVSIFIYFGMLYLLRERILKESMLIFKF